MDTIRISLTPQQRREAALEYRTGWAAAPGGRPSSAGQKAGTFALGVAVAANVTLCVINVLKPAGHAHVYILEGSVSGLISLALFCGLAYIAGAGAFAPAILREAAVTPAEAGLILATPGKSRLIPWSQIRRALSGRDSLLIEFGFRVIAIPKALDQNGELWSLLREKLTGTRMLIPGSEPRSVIVNTATRLAGP